VSLDAAAGMNGAIPARDAEAGNWLQPVANAREGWQQSIL
jgi:hypothetical protein